MVNLGKYNELKVVRKKDYGFFLDGNTGNIKDDILLPNGNISEGLDLKICDIVNVFVYRDSQKRLVATQKNPKACAGDVAILKVCDNSEIGSFVDFGLERDILVPFREKKYPLFVDNYYPFYIYVDKSNRLAATTDIGAHLDTNSNLSIDDKCNGYVFGFQTNGTALICIEPNYYGIILREEIYSSVREGDYLKNLRVIKIYEDGRIGLSAREERSLELDKLQSDIISYMQGNDGFMRFNDKSDPEELRVVFNTSKKNFKRSLGILMKNNIVKQNEEGTWLL